MSPSPAPSAVTALPAGASASTGASPGGSSSVPPSPTDAIAAGPEASLPDPSRRRFAALPDRLRERLAANAPDEDSGTRPIEESVALLREAGWLGAARAVEFGGAGVGRGGAFARTSVRVLMDVAEANLSLARLFEGHVNALWLLETYADATLREEVAELAADGVLFGVWGADAENAVSWHEDGERLDGAKRFASGLGSVKRAVVSARAADGTQRLCLVDTGDAARADSATWTMSGMRATRSGDYDFSGLRAPAVRAFGEPDAYGREPGLVGGVWRIAALQLGATYALLEAARTALAARGRLEAEAQLARLAPLLWQARAAQDLVVRAAALAGGAHGQARPERAVALSLFARLSTEELAQRTIAAVERSIGLAHFAEGSPSGRIARDLATYIRQISPDAFVLRAGRYALSSPERLSTLFELEPKPFT